LLTILSTPPAVIILFVGLRKVLVPNLEGSC
jgi:hypothetical protein